MNKTNYVSIEKLREVGKTLNAHDFRIFARKVFSYPENIDTFARFCFPDFMTNETPKFHYEIYDMLFSKRHSYLAAPRGHAKSTITGVIFVTFSIVNNMEKYIVYISQNHAKTVQFLEPIRQAFSNNEIIQYVYDDIHAKLVKDKDGRNREDCLDVNDIRVEALSFEKDIRGYKSGASRPTLIIGDDIEGGERVINPESRVKDAAKLSREIIPSLDPDGKFKMIGTILHPESLLSKRIKKYNGRIYKACDENFNDVLWEERFTKEHLKNLRNDIGELAFHQEYMNNPEDTGHSVIRREWLEQCLDPSLSYDEASKNLDEYDVKTLGVDFAFSDRITADYSAYASLGKNKDNKHVLFNLERFKGKSALEQMDYIQNFLHEKHDYDFIGVEENSIKSVSKEVSELPLPITMFWTSRSEPDNNVPDYKKLRQTVGKINLIARLGVAFENKSIILPYRTDRDKMITDRLIAECMSYVLSSGKLVEATIHPDIPIALGYAMELMNRTKLYSTSALNLSRSEARSKQKDENNPSRDVDNQFVATIKSVKGRSDAELIEDYEERMIMEESSQSFNSH